ncbi:hypothetical protein KW794_02585 [Candidatus Saccharibacteria bacterium]|nr:hypothetical protein [Candidatus Saccharibacteria bacterium]
MSAKAPRTANVPIGSSSEYLSILCAPSGSVLPDFPKLLSSYPGEWDCQGREEHEPDERNDVSLFESEKHCATDCTSTEQEGEGQTGTESISCMQLMLLSGSALQLHVNELNFSSGCHCRNLKAYFTILVTL